MRLSHLPISQGSSTSYSKANTYHGCCEAVPFCLYLTGAGPTSLHTGQGRDKMPERINQHYFRIHKTPGPCNSTALLYTLTQTPSSRHICGFCQPPPSAPTPLRPQLSAQLHLSACQTFSSAIALLLDRPCRVLNPPQILFPLSDSSVSWPLSVLKYTWPL